MAYMISNVYDALSDIDATYGRIDKIEKLRTYLADPTFKRVVQYAYDPFKTFGIEKVPPHPQHPGGLNDFTPGTWQMLDDLASRTLSGQRAWDALVGASKDLSSKVYSVLVYILRKDLRAGFTVKSVNQASPGLIAVFECMLAHPYEEKRVKKWPVIVQPKLDGLRTLAIVKEGSAKFVSRTGREFTALVHLTNAVLQLASRLPILGGVVFDGEVIAGEFNYTSGLVRQQGGVAENAIYHIFDVLSEADFKGLPGLGSTQLIERERILQNAWIDASDIMFKHLRLVQSELAHNHEQVVDKFDKFRALGLEGVVVKNREAPYQTKRSNDWLKKKGIETIDAPIVNAFEGTGKYAGALGGFIVQLSNGARVSVGGGFSDEQRFEWWNGWQTAKGHLLGKHIEIIYHEKTPDGSLRHPRFYRFRPDKDTK